MTLLFTSYVCDNCDPVSGEKDEVADVQNKSYKLGYCLAEHCDNDLVAVYKERYEKELGGKTVRVRINKDSEWDGLFAAWRLGDADIIYASRPSNRHDRDHLFVFSSKRGTAPSTGQAVLDED
jgi:hypothetical protein